MNTPRLLPVILIVTLLLVPVVAGAQEGDAYRIGPKDVLSLTIYAGGEAQQQVKLTVSDEGIINVPFIGPVTAGGLTIPELRRIILEPLAADYFVDPDINLFVEEYNSLRYYITGAVASPGLYKTNTTETLLTLIAKAGGVASGRGDVAYILRKSSDLVVSGEDVENLMTATKPISVNIKQLLDEGDLSRNVALESGDVVYIPLKTELDVAKSNIYIEGQVKSPGVYPFRPGLTALNACLMAGGFDKFAAPNRTRIIRKQGDKQKIIRIDLEDVIDGKIPDIELQPGDLINVPETWL